jgi:hypothetical protein
MSTSTLSAALNKLNELPLRAFVWLQTAGAGYVEDVARDRTTRNSLRFGAGLGAFTVAAGVARAAGGAVGGSGSCSTSAVTAGSTLKSFVDPITDFLIVLAGAGFVIMLMLGALAIMFGHTAGHKTKGINYLKNAVIGFIVVLGAFAIKEVVTLVVGSAASSAGNANPCQGNI